MSLDDEAKQLLATVMVPRRRARPRIAEPFRDAQDFQVETPKGKLAAWRLGTGPAVLLVHGWEDDNALWGPLATALYGMGIAVVAFDLPAHGFSEGDGCSPFFAADAIKAVAAQLGPIDAIVTHSFGGPATGIALSRGLDVSRAVLIAPPRGRNRRWFKVAAEKGIPIEVVKRAREMYVAENGPFDFVEVAPTLKPRALIVHSADDEQVDWGQGRALADAWPGAEFVMCDGLGHRLIAQDASVIQRIVDFVA
ncbi:MAG: alpha/beta hydrolase [Terricaulis sp.]